MRGGLPSLDGGHRKGFSPGFCEQASPDFAALESFVRSPTLQYLKAVGQLSDGGETGCAWGTVSRSDRSG